MTYSHKPWQVLHSATVADCSPWLQVHRDHVRLPNGVEISDFYRISMPAYAMVFAVTTDRQVVLVEHYKHGPQSVSLELPAGYIESRKENPLHTAQRELGEETGYSAPHWQPLGNFFIDGNRGCGNVHAFLATEAVAVQRQQLEQTELLTVKTMSLAKLERAWLDGALANIAATAVTGLALAHLRQTKAL
jgi:ADP-ribose pyrophosphatase